MPVETEVIIALGSNLGDPEKNLHHAIELLGSLLIAEPRVSGFWQSEPWDMTEQNAGMFLNGAILGFTQLTPRQLLSGLQKIEVTMGRARNHSQGGSRLIDLDIITYGDEVIEDEDLLIPHPRAHERQFVLYPVMELKPGLVLPSQLETVEELADKAPKMAIIPFRETQGY